MSRQSRVQLNPYEAAALTRLVMGFCLGKGSLCVYSRSYVLQLPQRQRYGDYSNYQWRRLCQFIPTAKPPRFLPMASCPRHGQWRLRISSRWFETAYNLLYPMDGALEDGYRPFRLDANVLSMLGAEAIAALWADRAQVSRSGRCRTGRINLARLDTHQAELVGDWIATLTGAHGRVAPSSSNPDTPTLIYDHENLRTLLAVLAPSWMGQAECLNHKFEVPEPGRSRAALIAAPLEIREPGGSSSPVPRHPAAARRRQLPPALPLDPPQLRQASA